MTGRIGGGFGLQEPWSFATIKFHRERLDRPRGDGRLKALSTWTRGDDRLQHDHWSDSAVQSRNREAGCLASLRVIGFDPTSSQPRPEGPTD